VPEASKALLTCDEAEFEHHLQWADAATDFFEAGGRRLHNAGWTESSRGAQFRGGMVARAGSSSSRSEPKRLKEPEPRKNDF